MEKRIERYFDPAVSDDDLAKAHPEVMGATKRYDPIAVRKTLRSRGPGGEFVRYAYRPFDVRWLYWDRDTKLLDEKRDEFKQHVTPDNLIISAQQKSRGEWHGAQANTSLTCLDLLDRGSSNFPTWLNDAITKTTRPNLSASMEKWLGERGIPPEALALHVLATLRSPGYAKSNAGALRSDWARIPIPSDPEVFKRSAAYGSLTAQLLNPEFAVAGVTAGALHGGLSEIGVPRGKSYELKGWGYRQVSRTGSNIVMPATGDAKQRDWSADEKLALIACGERHGLSEDSVFEILGSTAYDVAMNNDAFWQGVPAAVWNYELGGYIVLRKWLSYRDEAVLGRPLTGTEVLHLSGVVRRLTELMLLGPALDVSHEECRKVAVGWQDGRPVEPSLAASSEIASEADAEPANGEG